MSSNKPALLIIPGARVPSIAYYPLAGHFRSLGHEVYVPSLPTVGRRPVPPGEYGPGLYDDAAFVAAQISTLVNAGREVVLLAHSYGGMVMTEGVKGLSKQERAEKGLQGGIVRLIYMSAFAPAVGEAMSDHLEMKGTPEKGEKVEDPYMDTDPAVAGPWVFSDMEPGTARELGIRYLQEQSWLYLMQPITWPGYKYVPSTYLFATKDIVIPPALQRKQIEILNQNAPMGENGKAVEVDVVEIHVAHGIGMGSIAFDDVVAAVQRVFSSV